MSLQKQRNPLIKRGWIRALLLFITYLLLSVIAGIVIAVFIVSNNKTGMPAAGANEAVSAGPSMLFIAVTFIVSFISVFIFRKYIDRRSFVSLGLQLSKFYPDALIGLFTGLFLVSTGALIIFLLKGLQWVDISFDNRDFFFSAILLVLVALSEELVFRGYILRNLMKSFNKWIALLISSALFAIVHISNPEIPPVGMINIFLGGIVLGITFMYSRNLWLPVLFHFSWNFIQGPVLGFPVSGFPFGSMLSSEENANLLINGGKFGFEGSVVCSVLLILASVVFFLLYTFKHHDGNNKYIELTAS